MTTLRHVRITQRYGMRTRIKATPVVSESSPTASFPSLPPAFLDFLKTVAESFRAGDEFGDKILMTIAEELTPRPDELAAIRANLPPSPYNYDGDEELPY